MKTKKFTIKSPEGVAKLMKDLWINHKAGTKLQGNNVFWVELPPTTQEELKIARKKYGENNNLEESDNEDDFGIWI